MADIRRRSLLTGAAGAAAIAGIGGMDLGAAGPAEAAPEAQAPGRGHPVRLREGTDLAAQLSPDGRLIAIDIVGVLWVLPASGVSVPHPGSRAEGRGASRQVGRYGIVPICG